MTFARLRMRQAVALAVLASSVAFAHGAALEVGSLEARDEPEATFLAGASFGVLRGAADSGWQFICGESIGPAIEGLALEASPRGRFLAATAAGVRWSDDLGCNWQSAEGPSGGALAVSASRDGGPWVLAALDATADAGPRIVGSADRGTSFPETWATLERDERVEGLLVGGTRALALVVAPTRHANALLVSTGTGPAARRPLSLGSDATARLLTVVPGGEDTAVVAVDHASGRPAELLAVPLDGGRITVLAVQPAGFVAAAMDDTGTLWAGGATGGFALLPDGGSRRMPLPGGVHAIARSAGRLVVVIDGTDAGFAIVDLDPETTDAHALLAQRDVGPPPACLTAVCEATWKTVQAQLRPEPGSPDAGAPEPLAVKPPTVPRCGCSASTSAPAMLALVVAALARRRFALGFRAHSKGGHMRTIKAWLAVAVGVCACGGTMLEPGTSPQSQSAAPLELVMVTPVTTTCGGTLVEYLGSSALSVAAHDIAQRFPNFQAAQSSTTPKFIDAHPSPLPGNGSHAELEGFSVTMVQAIDWNTPIDGVSGSLSDPGLLFFQKNSGSQSTWQIIGAGYFFDFTCAKPSMSGIPSSKWLVHEAGYHLTGSSGGFTCASNSNLKSSAISAGVTIDTAGCVDVNDDDLKLHFGDVKHGRKWTVHVWFDPNNGNAIIAPTDPFCRFSSSAVSICTRGFFQQGSCTCN